MSAWHDRPMRFADYIYAENAVVELVSDLDVVIRPQEHPVFIVTSIDAFAKRMRAISWRSIVVFDLRGIKWDTTLSSVVMAGTRMAHERAVRLVFVTDERATRTSVRFCSTLGVRLQRYEVEFVKVAHILNDPPAVDDFVTVEFPDGSSRPTTRLACRAEDGR